MVGNKSPVAGISTRQSATSVKACLWRDDAYPEETKTPASCSRIFGEIKNDSDHVNDVWRHPGAESEFAELKEMQKEATYQYMRLEAKRDQPALRSVFGKASKCGDDTAAILVNAPCDDDGKVRGLKPGEQLRRNYDWDIDVSTHRFGSKGPMPGFNGASSFGQPEDEFRAITSTRLEHFKNRQPKLGRGSDARPDDSRIYGRPLVGGTWDARACLQGAYSEENQQPDFDLGTTHTPGYRNFQSDAVFGIPSVRSHAPKHEDGKCISQASGDDACARELIYPSRMMSAGLDDATELALKPRTKCELESIFENIGTPLAPNFLDVIYDALQAKNGTVTLDAFRREMMTSCSSSGRSCIPSSR